jgi:myosin heavy subunit
MEKAAFNFCFISDAATVFKLMRIAENLPQDQILVVPYEDGKTNSASQRMKITDVIPVYSIDELKSPPTDLIKLQNVYQATILHTLHSRFVRNQIYTSIGPILVALNPFKLIREYYEDSMMERYRRNECNLSDDPHVFAVANDAFHDLLNGQNQSLIIR